MTVLDRITAEDAKECRRVLALTREHLDRGRCRYQLARDHRGVSCPPDSARACKWCLIGALCAAVDVANVFDFHPTGGTRGAHLLEGLFEQALSAHGVADWADAHEDHELFALIDGVDQALEGVAA